MNQFQTNQFKRRVERVFWITLLWMFFALLQSVIIYSTIVQYKCEPMGISPLVFFSGSLGTGLVAGLIGGSLMVFGWENWLRSKNYGKALFEIFYSFCLVYILIAALNGLFYMSHELDLPFYDVEVLKNSLSYLVNIGNVQSFMFWLTTVMGTLILLQVSDKYGPGIFKSFLLGKYFKPIREERIFMFLDLRSSTTIAEKLGEEKYFKFIRTVFEDVTPAILNSSGEIYQYVGDEIVISWKMEDGLKNENCIHCFFKIQEALLERKNHYKSEYDGVRPVFKAGLHYGHVMAGEVGLVKRDIAYSGDVLNTAARIQSKCNDLGVDILLSQYLMDQFKLSNFSFNPSEIGKILLRGKQEQVVLYTIN